MNNNLTRLFVSILAAIMLATAFASCGGDTNNYPATAQEADEAGNETLEETGATSLSLVFIADGRVQFTRSFGYADKNSRTLPNADTMYGIGSTSKMFATIATMKLVDEGKIALDNPVTDYIPEFSMLSPEYSQITVRMLLNHSSGFPGSDYRNTSTSLPYQDFHQQVVTSLANEYLKHSPGYLNTYCNDGFSLIETLVEKVSGKTFPQYVQENIFDPLGMDHSAYPLEVFEDGTYAYNFTGDERDPFSSLNAYASGGLYSTPIDMAKFAMMILGNGKYGSTRIVTPSAISAMAVDQTAGTFDPSPSVNETYGIGWDTINEGGLAAVGVTAWDKGGDTDYYSSDLIVLPEHNMAAFVVGTKNIGSARATGVAERILLRALYEKGVIDEFPSKLPATPKPEREPTVSELNAIEGYFAAWFALYRFDVNDDKSIAMLKYNGSDWAELGTLKMRTDDKFSTDASPLTEFFTVTGDDRTYLVLSEQAGWGHYQNNQTSAQKIAATSSLSDAWRERLSRTWLLVNELPSSLSPTAYEPRLNISEPTGLTGLIAVTMNDGIFYIVDPSQSDTLAKMILLIPQTGRDINDLFIVSRGGEEWARFGSYFYRPKESVEAVIPTVTAITIGAEGYAEWRTVESGGASKTVNVVTNSSWRVFDPNMTYISTTNGSGSTTLPATSGKYYIIFYGNTGDTITVDVE